MIAEIRKYWDDSEKLQGILLDIADAQFKLADAIASSERSFSDAFVGERESQYKGSDAMARQKAKQLVGTQQTQYEYDFQVYTNLIGIVTFRISQLSQDQAEVRVQTLSPSGATSGTDAWLETK
jgi:hypothetical protein